MMPTARSAKALARKVVTTQRVSRWEIWLKGKKLGSGPAKTVGHTKAEAVEWARRVFPHLTHLEVRGV